MSKAQGLPVNMIVLTALALLVLVVVGAFFISGFGSAGASMQITNATQAECQAKCQGMVASAFNYETCNTLEGNPQVAGYTAAGGCATQFGVCTVTVRGGITCACDVGGCT